MEGRSGSFARARGARSGATVNVLDARTTWGYLQIVDFPGASYEPTLLGTAPPTGALLVVSATDSIQPGTWDSLQNARQYHVARVVVALTKCDQCEDPEMLDLVTMEIRETLTKHRFDGDGRRSCPCRRCGTSRIAGMAVRSCRSRTCWRRWRGLRGRSPREQAIRKSYSRRAPLPSRRSSGGASHPGPERRAIPCPDLVPRQSPAADPPAATPPAP